MRSLCLVVRALACQNITGHSAIINYQNNLMHDYLIRLERRDSRAARRELLKCLLMLALLIAWFASLPFIYELVH